MTTIGASFGDFVKAAQDRGELVVQPRSGTSCPRRMRDTLAATKRVAAVTAGTITLDSYTRLGQHDLAARAVAAGDELNGYPIVAHGATVTRRVLEGIQDAGFPVQVRHGSAQPEEIFSILAEVGVAASEGGPVSYCLPYGRTPLAESVASWTRCCAVYTRLRDNGVEPHLETFGGSLLGQLCPPSLLVAISVLEGLFFWQNGIRSISLSYAQQTSPSQDLEALAALRRLVRELLPEADTHVVVYTYMGLFPRSPQGARRLLELSAELAVRGGAARLIVKTAAEAFRIPTIAENTDALAIAARAAADTTPDTTPDVVPLLGDTQVYAEARALVEAVLTLDERVGAALVRAFAAGILDVPYCVHPDNNGAARSYLASDGTLLWASSGSMPLGRRTGPTCDQKVTSADLLTALSHVRDSFDDPVGGTARRRHRPRRPSVNGGSHARRL